MEKREPVTVHYSFGLNLDTIKIALLNDVIT